MAQTLSETSIQIIKGLTPQETNILHGSHSSKGQRKDQLNEDIFSWVPINSKNFTEEKAAAIVYKTFAEIAGNCQNNSTGSTLSIAFSHKPDSNEKVITVGSVGDSSIFLVICDEHDNPAVCELINSHHTHKNVDEVKRLFLLGGHTISKRKRLNDSLMILRTLGDKVYVKSDYRLYIPDIYHIKIPTHLKAYLVLTSDGFTDAAYQSSPKEFLLKCLKANLNSDASLNQVAKYLCDASNKIIKRSDDTTVGIIQINENDFATYIADGHGGDYKEKNFSNETSEYINDNFFKFFLNNLSFFDTNDNNSTINEPLHNLQHLHNEAQEISPFGVSIKTLAYPITDGWLDKQTDELLINLYILCLADKDKPTKDKKLFDLKLIPNEPLNINSELLSLANLSKDGPDMLTSLYAKFLSREKETDSDEFTTEEKILLKKLKVCSEQKSLQPLRNLLTNSKLNADIFYIFVNNMKKVLSYLNLNNDPFFRQIYTYINDATDNVGSAIKLLHEISLFNPTNQAKDQVKKFAHGSAKAFSTVTEKTSGFFKNLGISNLPKINVTSETLTSVKEKLTPDPKEALRIAAQDALVNFFKKPMKESMDALKVTIQHHQLGIELEELPELTRTSNSSSNNNNQLTDLYYGLDI